MANGICDIAGCTGKTHMGWRPLCSDRGYQICKQHFEQHSCESNKFDLFDVFGYSRLKSIEIWQSKNSSFTDNNQTNQNCCRDCGLGIPQRKRFCEKCANNRERKRKREYRRKKEQAKLESLIELPKENLKRCKTENCGRSRKYGHSYCDC